MSFILLFDDDIGQLKTFKSVMSAIGLNYELKMYEKIDDFKKAITNDEITKNTKVIIYDLAKDSEEAAKGSFEISEDIISNYNNFRVPLFIHSGHLDHFRDLHNKGNSF